MTCSGSYRKGCRCAACKDKKRNEAKRPEAPIVTEFTCTITCPLCAAAMQLVNRGRALECGTYGTAIWSCAHCRRRFQLTQTLRALA
jgi:transposase-like protein